MVIYLSEERGTVWSGEEEKNNYQLNNQIPIEHLMQFRFAISE